MPTVTIDFYGTEDVEGRPLDISGLIVRSAELPFAQRRMDFGDSFVCLHDVHHHGLFVRGEVLRAKMTDVPEKVNRNDGQPRDLGLLADEGIAHRAHFFYDGRNRVLLFQRERNVRSPAFVHSVSGPVQENFGLSLIFKRDALERLDRMRVVRRIAFRVARPDDPRALIGNDVSAGRAIDLLNDLGGVEVEVNVSVGRSRARALDRNAVLRVANALFGRREQEVRKIIVSGKEDPEGGTETLDLLEDRLVYSSPIDFRRRRLDPRQCEVALRQAHDEHAAYLAQYRPPE